MGWARPFVPDETALGLSPSHSSKRGRLGTLSTFGQDTLTVVRKRGLVSAAKSIRIYCDADVVLGLYFCQAKEALRCTPVAYRSNEEPTAVSKT